MVPVGPELVVVITGGFVTVITGGSVGVILFVVVPVPLVSD